MEPFDGPAIFHEVVGEPVEEFGMRGRTAEGSEIGGTGGQGFAEMVLPDAVDDDACGQRVRLVGEPFCEGGTSSG